MMATCIVPVTYDVDYQIVARAPVLRVFDTNGGGELLPVEFRRDPASICKVSLLSAPYSQVYVEIDE